MNETLSRYDRVLAANIEDLQNPEISKGMKLSILQTLTDLLNEQQ